MHSFISNMRISHAKMACLAEGLWERNCLSRQIWIRFGSKKRLRLEEDEDKMRAS